MSKQRRIIYNDDGAGEVPSHNPEATAAGFLAAYFNSAVCGLVGWGLGLDLNQLDVDARQ